MSEPDGRRDDREGSSRAAPPAGTGTDLVPRRESKRLREFALKTLGDIAHILTPRVLTTLKESLYWVTFGRIRAHDFALAFYVALVVTMGLLAIAVSLLGMGISPPMMGVLLLLGAYLPAILYRSHAEQKQLHTTPEWERIRAINALSESQYAALDDHAEQMRKRGATDEAIAAELDAKRRSVLRTKLQALASVTGDRSQGLDDIDAAHAVLTSTHSALDEHAAHMQRSGSTPEEIEAELGPRRIQAFTAHEEALRAARVASLFPGLPAAEIRRDKAYEALSIHAAHMRKHGATEAQIAEEIGPRSKAVLDAYMRDIDRAERERRATTGRRGTKELGPGSGGTSELGRGEPR